MPRIVFLLLLACAPLAAASDCRQPLSDATLNQLRLGASDVQLRPGDTYQFALAIPSSYKPAEKVPACAVWTVEPEGKGASISSKGLLKIASGAPAGSRFIVTADIENGRAKRQIVVLIYTNKSQPLVGLWKQLGSAHCQGKEQISPFRPINELEFRVSNWFSVTWQPFETYRDYWGKYAAKNASGAISLQIEQGNWIPADFHGNGKYKIKPDGTLELRGIYLGDRGPSGHGKQTSSPRECRYIFTRIQ